MPMKPLRYLPLAFASILPAALAAQVVITFEGTRQGDPIPLDSALEWVNSIKGAKLMVIENSGHFPYLEQPKEFFAAVEGALKR